MNNLENFDDSKNEFKEIVFFNDGRMTPKNDSMIYEIIKKVFIAVVIILIVGNFFFKEFLFADESI